MASTYMNLTNNLLRRLNEVEITESDFLSVKNIQATAKDCILDALREINTMRIDWPFNAVEHTESLVVGTEEYAWPTTFIAADWNSFQIQQDDSLNVNHRVLFPISREEWYEKYRDKDYDASTDGISTPVYVFPAHGQGFGLSPSPDETFTLKYRYYKTPEDPSAFDDEITIPTRFDYVVLAGALYHLNLFKENSQGAKMAEERFNRGLSNMNMVYLPNPKRMWDGMIVQRQPSMSIWNG